MNNKINTTITLVIIGVVIAAIAVKLSKNKQEVSTKVYHPDVNTKVLVQVDTIKSSKFDISTNFIGVFKPNREVVLGSETSGKVIRVNVEQGDFVQKGTLLAQLDDGVLRAQLQSAQATFQSATNTLHRYQQATSGVTQLQIDNAKTDILTAQAQIDQLKRQIDQHYVLVPFNGIITERNFDLGAIISPGTQMATLTDISSLKLEINVPERNVMQFKNGQKIDIRTDVYPNINFTGTVDMIASKADASYNFLVKIIVSNKKNALKAGMYGSLAVENQLTKNALTIPRSALIGSALNPQIYIVKNGRAKIVNIQTANGNSQTVEATSGVHEGDIVISGGLVNIQDGTKVAIVK